MNCTLTVPLSTADDAPQPAQPTCPPWCTTHLDTVEPEVTLHVSQPSEVSGVAVTVEQFDTATEPVGAQLVNVQSFDRRLTAGEARQLAALLCFYAAMLED